GGHASLGAADMLDYATEGADQGRDPADDLAEAKATLLLIHAMPHSDEAVRQRLRAIVEAGDADALDEVLSAIRACGSLEYCRQRAAEYADAAERALDSLPGNEAVSALRGLARYAVDRGYSTCRSAPCAQ